MEVLISIITINYNNASGLKATIDSVRAQSVSAVDFVVIDGGSSDNSLAIIEQNKDIITYYCSEKDKGIYDAQNKGIDHSKGTHLLFLNSGDTLYDSGVLTAFLSELKTSPAEILYGNTNLVSSKEPDRVLVPPASLDLYFLFRETINHQASLIKKPLFNEFGKYDLSYKFCSDFDFFFRVFLKRPEAYRYFDRMICNYNNEGLSSQKDNHDRMVREKQLILSSNLSPKQYKDMHRAYRRGIPLKYRIFEQIYKVPVLSLVFKKLVSFYEIYKRRKQLHHE
ncbi:MAG: glycosyltransferase family 2 protein [Bacteroidia bacterium]